ncbi:MAG: hypothetical protein M1822_000171 [Bathelium mastoideum]|nr:MAG: hypothetical protein M1822_000171 [Bathelium mastoideum]
MTTSIARAPITCHVLDTTTGLPAPNLTVTLSLLSVSSSSSSPATSLPSAPQPAHPLFAATTNADGRIAAWSTSPNSTAASSATEPDPAAADAVADALETLFALGRDDGRTLAWSLRFATGAYYGGPEATFWPEVEVKFWTGQGREHVHVPLLLGPYGYTTYRGS